MNSQEKYKNDPLMNYINTDLDLKVPEGFTTKVMNRIQFETVGESSAVKSRVPLISGLVIFILLIAALIVPSAKINDLTDPVFDVIRNLISQPAATVSSVFRFSIPSVTVYVIIGIFALSLFDRALHGIFKREK
jgi:hypothetical protein